MKEGGRKSGERSLQESLKRDEEAGLFRTLPDPLPDGVLDLRSNDHLGLTRDPGLGERIREALQGSSLSGSSGSRLISGNSDFIMRTEEEMASHYGSGTGLLFSSGYQANLGVISALGRRGCTLLYDEKVHASMRDGARLALARAYSFRHNDPVDLEKKLEKAEGPTFVLLETLYSMDGDLPPLRDMMEIADRYEASVVLDEAHSNGIIGKKGRGVAVREGIADRVLARIMPFGKAVAQQGAFVGGRKVLKDFLIGHARSFIYSTAPSFPALVALRESFHYCMEADQKRDALFERIGLFRRKAEEKGVPFFPDAKGPVQVLPQEGNEMVQHLERELREEGFAVKGIRKPTVPEGEERLRAVVHADTPKEGIEHFLDILKKKG